MEKISAITMEKLNDTNYETWKLHMRSVLICNDLWEYVDGTNVKPEDGGDNNLVKWQSKDSKALALIFLYVKENQLGHIKKAETSKAAWEILKSVHMSKGPTKKISLYRKLYKMKKKDDQSMQQHIIEFQNTVDQMEELGITLPNELVIIMLLNTLPDNFENFRIALEAQDKLPDLNSLKIKIIEEDSRRNEQSNVENGNLQNALVSKEKCEYNRRKDFKSNGQKQYKSKFEGACYVCNKKGHKANECRSRRRIGKSKETKEAAMITENVSTGSRAWPTSIWCLDSGASAHMCNNRNEFIKWSNRNQSVIETAGNEIINSYGCGTVILRLPKTDCSVDRVILNNVIFAPQLKYNFISVPKIVESDHTVFFWKNYATVEKNGSIIFKARKQDKLYTVKNTNGIALYSVQLKNDIRKWHSRFGHLNFTDLRRLEGENLVKGLNAKFCKNSLKCLICEKAKMTQLPYDKASIPENELLGTIHSDICGPFKEKSLGGCKYFVTFIDEFSRYMEVKFLKSRDEVFNAFKNFHIYAERETGKKIKKFRSDNAKEYTSKEFSKYLEQYGIQHQLSVPYTPQQNGIAERANRTLLNMARCMLLESGLPKSLWAEAVNTAAFVRNRCPTSIIKDKTPYEMWTSGMKPHVGFLKTFGCTAVALKKGPQGSKLDARGEKYTFVGYAKSSKGYRLWDGRSNSIIISRDVKFYEEIDQGNFIHITPETMNIDHKQKFAEKEELDANEIELLSNDMYIMKEKINEANRQSGELCEVNSILENSTEKLDTHHKELEDNNETKVVQLCNGNSNEIAEASHSSESDFAGFEESDGYETADEKPEKSPLVSRGRPKIIRTGQRGRPRKQKIQKVNLAMDTGYPNPISFEDAMESQENSKWIYAMETELSSLSENDTWEIVDRPKNKKILSNKWVFCVKHKEDGSIDKYKARLVVRGCEQRDGFDFGEIYAPVARYDTIRTLFAICANREMHLHNMDVITAFVQGELHDEIYMEMPKNPHQQPNPSKVCRLLKPLYGLKQASRQWHEKLSTFLKNIGLHQSSADQCMYSINKNGKTIILVVYVDDLLIASDCLDLLMDMKQTLMSKFKMKDLGKASQILGISIQRNTDTGNIEISQRKYIEKLLNEFNMADAKAAKTPIDNSNKLTKDLCPTSKEEILEMQEKPYRKLVGMLIYLSNTTRPDIAFAASTLSRFCGNPGKTHWIAAKRVLRYLKNSTEFKLIYRKSKESLCCFVDSDWAGDTTDRRSCTGYIIMMAGAPVSWKSRKQKCVALSTMEAEYIAMCEATKEIVFFKKLFQDLEFEEYYKDPIMVYCDNQSAIKFAKDNLHHERSKHVDIKFHFCREKQTEGLVKFLYTPTSNMIADILTKGLDKLKQENCIELLTNFSSQV